MAIVDLHGRLAPLVVSLIPGIFFIQGVRIRSLAALTIEAAKAVIENKQKELKMKKRLIRFSTILGLFVMLGVSSGNAQVADRIEVTIPFEFVAGERTLPAGDYVLDIQGIAPSVVSLQNRDTYVTAVRTISVQNRANEGQAKLVFQRYGNRHFLSQVWYGESRGREIPILQPEG
ncbi:MAG: hypothetical protein O7C73_04370 [Nitrospirae bacterium]|nr:hypothetical protein [Nitrospirota bacterium]